MDSPALFKGFHIGACRKKMDIGADFHRKVGIFLQEVKCIEGFFEMVLLAQ